MTHDIDVSPGTKLKAGTTGDVYTVQSVSDDHVSARGPTGPVTVDRDELEDDIDDGRIEVLSQ